jgi:hypothetical protein
METVKGELEAGEAQSAVATIGKRQRGSMLQFYLVLYGLIISGAVLGYGVGLAAQPHLGYAFDPVFPALFGIWIGAGAYRFLCRPLLVRRFRSRMAARGLDIRFHQALTIADGELTMESGPVRRVAQWSAVTEVFSFKGYWIFLVQMEPWFVPKRFFADESEERAFIGAALSRMSDDARSRSKDALALEAA